MPQLKMKQTFSTVRVDSESKNKPEVVAFISSMADMLR